MPYNDTIRTASALTGIGRSVFEATYNQFEFASYFPLREQPTRQFMLQQVVTAGPEAATKLTGYNTTAPRGDEESGGQLVDGRIGRTSNKVKVDEMNLISAPSNDQIGAWMEEKARSQAQRAANLLRLMTGELLSTGKVDLSTSQYKYVVDFNRPAANQVTLAAAKRWTAATATPLQDAMDWRDISGGDTLYIPQTIFKALQKNAELIKRALRRGTDLPETISAADVQSVFAEENLYIRVLDYKANQIVTYEGATRFVLPENQVYLLPRENYDIVNDSAIGEVHLGPTVESESAIYGIGATERPGIFVAASHEEDPEGYDVRVAGEFLPLLRAPGAVVVANVTV